MKNYKDFFKGKKVTIMGLGLLGGALNDALFLLECGADLIITDLKSEKELASSIKKLKNFKRNNGSYKLCLGQHNLEDFKNRDFILQPGNVPPDSPYLLEAIKNNIPIHESESLFFDNLPENIITIGITGTRGKTTTTSLIYKILKNNFKQKVYLAGNIKGSSTLSLLKKINFGDIVVLELDSWCLHGLGDIKKSPKIAVFTNFLKDHLNFYIKGSKNEEEALQKYFNDKANIYKYQNKTDILICGQKVSKKIGKINGKKIITNKDLVPKNWNLKIKGEHNLENIACAIKACEALNLPLSIVKKEVESFSGVAGRQEFVREFKGVKIYNDTTATTPDATIMALKAFGQSSQNKQLIKKKIVLICGGSDKYLDMSELIKTFPKYCKEVILLTGTGTDKLKKDFSNKTKSLKEFSDLLSAIKYALTVCQRGDYLIFSPAFASFGMFKNEFDRGDKFVKIIKNLH